MEYVGTMPRFPKITGRVGRPVQGNHWSAKYQNRIKDILEPGKLCMVHRKRQNGNHFYHAFQVFKIGERGYVCEELEDKVIFGIDVMPTFNEALGANETIVGVQNYSENSGTIITNSNIVSLTTAGVSTTRFPRTFRDGESAMISHDSGEWINEVHIGQKHIKKTYKKLLKEMELRSKSIPFILPTEYHRIDLGYSHDSKK